MVATVNLKVNGLKELQAKMANLGRGIPPALYSTTKQAVTFVHQKVPHPPTATREHYPFKTEKQRLFVILSIAEGSMKVPYRRTQTLDRSIVEEVKKLGSDIIGLLGTDLIYAPWVISEKRIGSRGPQSQYHSDNWYTLQEVVRDCREGVMKIYREGLLDRLLRP